MNSKQRSNFPMIIIKYAFLVICLTQLVKCEDNLDFKCLESSSHKAKPSLEDNLHGQVTLFFVCLFIIY